MKIPYGQKILVGGHEVEVLSVSRRDIEEKGEYDSDLDLIKIRVDDTTETVRAETFQHEILECINHKYDLQLEHTILTTISEVLFSVVRTNHLNFGEKDE